jgi:hypothetical protein
METKSKILIKFASRSRPEKCLHCLDNIYDYIEDKENYLILLSSDQDDDTMYNKHFIREIKKRIDKGYRINLKFGTSKSKVDAINRDIKLIKEWDIIINHSDDMLFEKHGFDNIIRSHFEDNFPDYDGCLHYNDGFVGKRLCTMVIMGKKYYDRFGCIYDNSYKSLWCDNEQTEVAVKLKRIKYFDMILFKHYHPANVGGYIDKQLMHTQSFNDVDWKNYSERFRKNFYL